MPPLVSNPSDADVLLAAGRAIQARIRGPLPCRVESYDRNTRTATIRPVMRMPHQDRDTGAISFEDPVAIAGVPVQFPALLTWDLPVGSYVAGIVIERSMDEWRLTGGHGHEPQDPARRHDLTDMIAIPNLLSPGGEFSPTAVAEGAAVLEYPDIRWGTGNPAELAYVTRADLQDAVNAAFTSYINTHTHGTAVGDTTPPVVPMVAPDSVACTTTRVK